ncbi:MAG: hypothetical protein RH917_11395 [Lacipirellulaceae bacterium]
MNAIRSLICPLWLGFFFILSAPSAQAAVATTGLPANVALYAGGTIEFGSFSDITDGNVVAGGDVTHLGGTLNLEALSSAGGFSSQGPAFQNSNGTLLFNGDVTNLGGPGSTFHGSITSTGGNIDFLDSSQTINGNVIAIGSVEWEFPFGTVNGDVTAGGGINVTASVSGSVTPGASISLDPYVLPNLPSGRNLLPGTQNVTLNAFDEITLAPGDYGTLSYASGNTVTLSAGSYVFEDIVSSFSLNRLNFDTTAGPIDLYISSSDFNLSDLVQEINGMAIFSTIKPERRQAQNIFIEVAGSMTVDGNFFGTLFAPNGDVSLETFTDITGRVFAGGNVVLGDADITFVPEPTTLAWLVLIAATGTGRRLARSPDA